MKIIFPTSCALSALVGLALPAAAWTQDVAQPVTAPSSQPAAQAPAAPPASQAAASANTGIADIVVTAQKREERLQSVPISVTALTGDQLAKKGLVSLKDLVFTAPAYTTSEFSGFSQTYLRGVGSDIIVADAEAGVATYQDGIYQPLILAPLGSLLGVQRVEILYGPQGTLYGRNAVGGAVNVITLNPSQQFDADAKVTLGNYNRREFSGYVSAGYGRFNAFDAEAAINLPLGDHGAFRASGKIVNTNGFNRDGTGDEIGQAFRLQMLGELTPNLTVRVSGDYSHTGGLGVGASFNGRLAYTPGSPATATSPAGYTYLPANLDVREGLLSKAGQAYFSTVVLGGPQITPAALNTPFQNNSYVGSSAEITWKTDVGTLTVIPAYRFSHVKNLFNGPAFRGGLVDEKDDQKSIEARFAGKSVGPVDWLIGGFYYDESIKGLYTFSQYTIQSYQDFTTGTKSAAGFGRLTLNLGDRFRLVGGARYTNDKKFFNGQALTLVDICTRPVTGPTAACAGGPSVPVARTYAELAALIPPSQIPAGLPPVPGFAGARPFGSSGNLLFYNPTIVNAKLNKSRLTYRFAGEFDVAPRSLLYASYETGYRSGGFAPAAGHETYQPEYIEALTIGSKNRFFGNKLQLNVEAYRWTYRDQQVAHFGLDSNGASNFFSENIGRSRIQGLDVDTEFRIAHDTTLRGSVQYLDNKLLSFKYNTPRGGTNLPPAVGCPFTSSVDSRGNQVYAVDCSGKTGFNAPKWAVNAGIDHTIEIGDLDLTATVDGRYRSNRVIGFEYIQQENSGSDFTGDASLTLGDRDKHWSITGWVHNFTDRAVPVLAQFAGATGNTVSTIYQAPRTYGVRGRFTF